MLNKACAIISPSSLGSGQYQFNLHFFSTSDAKYLRLGDFVTSGISSDSYKLIGWVGNPSDFSSGGLVTVQFNTTDVVPPADSGFDSIVGTPQQLDVRSPIQTEGTVGNISLFSGSNFEYTLDGGWFDLDQANLAVVGDSIVDANGKEFNISFLDPTQFNVPFRVTEVHKEGVAPVPGTSTLYRSTNEFKFFQGTEITDPARTVVQNRDLAVLDFELTKGLHSIAGEYLNSTGGTLNRLDLVGQDFLGNLATVDITDDTSVSNSLGVLKDDTDDSFYGTVITRGLIEDITTAFVVGDVVYLNTDGTLTTTIPEIGSGTFIAGQHVVRVGKITKNADDILNKDLLVEVVWEGTL